MRLLILAARLRGHTRPAPRTHNTSARNRPSQAEVVMDQVCDRHSSAKAQARVLLPNLGELFFCRHCADTLNFGPDFYIEYATVNV